MAVDATSFNTRYVTHVRGLKYEIVMDSHFDTVTAIGVGHRLWRECYFSKEEIRDLRSDVKTIVKNNTQTPKLRRDSYQMPKFMPLSALTFSPACRYCFSLWTGFAYYS